MWAVSARGADLVSLNPGEGASFYLVPRSSMERGRPQPERVQPAGDSGAAFSGISG